MQSTETPRIVAQRVAHNLELAQPILSEGDADRREALRLLFSTLFYLEKIAELAVRQGNGVPGQLEDEIVHGETFRAIANELGGLAPSPRTVADLHAFITSLDGTASLVILNIVAETWLENIMRHVGRWGIGAELFALIADEERRHSNEALASAKIDPAAAAPYIRELERYLYVLSIDPYLMYPICFLAGTKAMAFMGEAITSGHKSALAALGVEVTEALHEVIRCGADVASDLEPKLIEQSPWERSAWNAKFTGPIVAYLDVPLPTHLPTTADVVEAFVVSMLGHVLAIHPRLNRTFNSARRELYQCSDVLIGVRRLFNAYGDVVTVLCRNPSLDYWPVAGTLRTKTARTRALPYPEVPDLESLARLLPCPRASATVSNLMGSGIERGQVALAEYEGASIGIGIANLNNGVLSLSIVMDHRVHNGRELGLLSSELREWLS